MKLPYLLSIATTLSSLVLPLSAQNQRVYQKGFLSQEEALASIEVPDGYELQLVLSDPIIKEPVDIAWDANGAMYVVEMRTYMQDADASDEKDSTSVISRHEDSDGDGVYDKHSTYINRLLLPRMILPLDNRLMVGITDTLDLWNYSDSTGNGKANKKTKIYNGGRRGGNMEHQPSGLVWGVDNWIYITYESIRYRFTDGKLVTEKIPKGNGQWGLAQDDDGRFFYSRAGGESPAEGFQQQPQYGLVDTSGQLAGGFKSVYPIAPVPDVQGGAKRVGSNGGINVFTGCGGQTIFNGDALPEELYGNLFIPEPVGRLVRRAAVDRSKGVTTLTNATPRKEFIRSKDVNFRPLQVKTGPDGCLYIVDMHRGIIQQGNWTKKGSYLRGIIDKWDLDKNIGKGRIYRLVHKDHKPGPKPNMLDEKTKDLVQHLSHKNGWWRDTAKRLIILREDRQSVVPDLESNALNTSLDTQARLTNLWTLEGMSEAKPELLVKLLSDSESRIVTNAIRVSEKWLKESEPTVATALEKLSVTDDDEIAIQLINSIEYVGNPAALGATYSRVLSKSKNHPVVKASRTLHGKKIALQETAQGSDSRLPDALEHGQDIYSQLCSECHGGDGKGTPMAGAEPGVTLAPALNSSRITGSGESLVRIILHGLQGPLDDKTYAAGIMPPQNSNDDQWIADVATYIRNDFQNSGSMITPEMVKSIRDMHSSRKEMWTQAELDALEAKELKNQKRWKVSASHGQYSAKAATDRKPETRYSSGKNMEPGMWYQIQLPSPVNIQRVAMEHQKFPLDFPSEYTVSLSMDGKKWTTSKKQTGTSSVTTYFAPNQKARFIRINQKGKSGTNFWSINEIRLFGN